MKRYCEIWVFSFGGNFWADILVGVGDDHRSYSKMIGTWVKRSLSKVNFEDKTTKLKVFEIFIVLLAVWCTKSAFGAL